MLAWIDSVLMLSLPLPQSCLPAGSTMLACRGPYKLANDKPSMLCFYADWQPLIVVSIQRYTAQLLAAAQQYAATFSLEQATADIKKDLGPRCGFPWLLDVVDVKNKAEICQYALGAVRKLTTFEFAKLSIFELWFCGKVWDQAGLPAAAVEVLCMWQGMMHASLAALFSYCFLCPDYRGLNLFHDC